MTIEDPEKIRFSYVPLAKWTVGAVFLLAGLILLLIGAVTGFFSWFVIIFVGSALLIIFGNRAFLFAPMRTVDLCIESKYIQVMSTRIYGKSVERYYFSQVEKFKSYKGKLNFSQQYFLALILANRKSVKLKVPISQDKQETVKLIKKLNKVIRNK